jgi:hypothetical protein
MAGNLGRKIGQTYIFSIGGLEALALCASLQSEDTAYICVCVCVCVCVCARACVCVCARARVCVC